MKIIFAGRDNAFNRKYICELSRDHELLSCLFLEPDRFRISGRFSKIRNRVHKYGFLKVADELAYHLIYRAWFRKPVRRLINSRKEYFYGKNELSCPVLNVRDIHDASCIDYIRNSSPDIIFSICSSVIFKPELFNLPRYGTFILHEGITPEYRGLHTTLWALLKKDYEHVGYTLLKASEEIDGGDVIVQEKYFLKKGEDERTWSWVGHNALIEGIGTVSDALREIDERQSLPHVDTSNRESRLYTWMSLSSYIKLKFSIGRN